MFISFNADPSLMPFELRRRAWMHAREEARAAYRAWTQADEEPERKIAFAVYRAAEEREAAAARAFGVS
jgi:hypothetical protein